MGFAIVIFLTFLISLVMATYEGARAWGPLAAVGIFVGLIALLVVLGLTRVPFLDALAVAAGVAVFRKAQTSRIAQLAEEPLDHDEVASTFE